MAYAYFDLFLGLLTLYVVYAAFQGISAKYPLSAAVALLVASFAYNLLGRSAVAQTLAVFVLFLLGGGGLLLVTEHLREALRRPVLDPLAKTGSPERRPTQDQSASNRGTE